MVNYNLSNFSGSSNLLEMFVAVDTASGNLLGMLSLLSIFIVMFTILLRQNESAQSFTAASLFTTLISLLFLAGGIISLIWVIGFAVLFALGAVILYMNKYV